jgi:hypothetical protein
MKPVTLSEFNGDCTKGQAFLNSCELYIHLADHQFADDDAKIYWALSYMKGGRAAKFTDRTMRVVATKGSLPWFDWTDFREEVIAEFCPKNDTQTARAELETNRYHQGSQTVDEYVDSFTELIERAGYAEGSSIVLKFRRGLDSAIQNQVACLTNGRPSDENPKEWYEATILADDNRIANSAFQASIRQHCHTALSAPPGLIHTQPQMVHWPFHLTPNPIQPAFAAFGMKPTTTMAHDPDAMDVNATHHCGPATVVCYHCGKTRHVQKDCLHVFNVCYMMTDEREDFLQQELAAMDVRATGSERVEEEEREEPEPSAEETEEGTDFRRRSE